MISLLLQADLHIVASDLVALFVKFYGYEAVALLLVDELRAEGLLDQQEVLVNLRNRVAHFSPP